MRVGDAVVVVVPVAVVVVRCCCPSCFPGVPDSVVDIFLAAPGW